MYTPSTADKYDINNLYKLNKACQNYINELSKGGPHIMEAEQDVFMKALELIYGEDIWDYVDHVFENFERK
jgi:hypothetical protein